MKIQTIFTFLIKNLTVFMLCRSIPRRNEKSSVRLQKGDRAFVETRAIDFNAEFSPSLNCEFKV
ncbi:hypothetical protein QUB37_24615 [Microcoleus sp. AT3-A2]|uniref:hypothetical protein n=1 Tax=Microcoleus sp. Pol10D4 TaxID=3055387 RepID=UPI002FD6A6A0